MRRLTLLCIGLLAAGCSETELVNSGTDSGGLDTIADTSSADVSEPDSGQPDTTEPDAAEDDTAEAPTCEPGEGCFGESCTDADDCLSGICTMHMGDQVCSKTCDEACPEGFACTLVGSGGDG